MANSSGPGGPVQEKQLHGRGKCFFTCTYFFGLRARVLSEFNTKLYLIFDSTPH